MQGQRSRSEDSHHGFGEVQVRVRVCTRIAVDICHGGCRGNRHATPRCWTTRRRERASTRLACAGSNDSNGVYVTIDAVAVVLLPLLLPLATRSDGRSVDAEVQAAIHSLAVSTMAVWAVWNAMPNQRARSRPLLRRVVQLRSSSLILQSLRCGCRRWTPRNALISRMRFLQTRCAIFPDARSPALSRIQLCMFACDVGVSKSPLSRGAWRGTGAHHPLLRR